MQLDRDNPWPGLESFEEDAQAFFFGRDHEITMLGNHVLDSPVTVLYGRSGLGKTSLLQAGLFPVLRERHLLPIYVRFDLKPDASPLTDQLHHAVRDSIKADVPDAILPSDQGSLWEYLHRKDFELWSTRNYPLTPVIVLDQFEELFTLGERVPDLVRAFRDNLGDLAENRIPPELAARIEDNEAVAARFDLRSRKYKLLISLREDFLPELEGWRQLIPALGRSRVRLLNLRTSDALSAVRKPATHLMTDPLARRVVAIVAGEDLHPGRDTEAGSAGDHHGGSEVEPALLSLFCRELNEERKRRGQPHFDEQLVEVAKRDILSNYYSSCVRDLPPRVAGFIESKLITEKGFRNSYPREDAVPSHLTDDELTQLIHSRLLRLEERYGAQRIELTHDVLTRVVREHRDRRRANEESAAREARLVAEQQRQQAELRDAQERRQAAEDYAHALRKRSRILRAVLAGTVVIAVLALVAAIVAVRAQDQADAQRLEAAARSREALGERLTSEGTAILAGGKPGSELEAIVKVIAAQHISSKHNLGGLLIALDRQSRLHEINPASGILSGDGQRIADTSRAGIQMVDTRTWQPVGRPFDDPQGVSTGLSFSGRYLASSNDDTDKTIRVWDFDTGNYIGQPMHGAAAWSNIAVSADGRRVAAPVDQGAVGLWDTPTGRLVATLPVNPDAAVTALAFSPDGRRFATAGGKGEGTVRLWDAETGAALRETSRFRDEAIGDYDFITSLAFSPDGSVIAAGGYTTGVSSISGGTPLRLWNADSGALIGTPAVGDYGIIRSLAFSPDGHRIATGSDDKTVRLWDAGTSQPIGNPMDFQSGVEQVAFTPDGANIVAVSGEAVQKLDGDLDDQLAALTAGSRAAALGPDDRYGVDTTPDVPQIQFVRDNALHRLDADTGQQVSVFANDALRSMRKVDSSRDQRWLAILGEDNVIRVLDTTNGQPVGKPLIGHNGHLNDLAFSPDGKVLATASDDKTVRMWDWRNGEQIGEPLTGHETGVIQVIFSEDGAQLFSRGVDSIWIWDTATRPPTGKQVGGPDSPSYFTAMEVSPDGNRLATVSGQGDFQQWDVGSGQAFGPTLKGHSGINDIAYSPDGDYLISVGAVDTDDTLRFWDAASGSHVDKPVSTEPMGSAEFISFSKDGHSVYVVATPVTLTGSGPTAGQRAIWRLPAPAEWEHLLCAKLTANPSNQQWQDWISPDVPYEAPCPDKPRAP